jgi:hypothetical protein
MTDGSSSYSTAISSAASLAWFGIAPAELRRRNTIPASAMPYKTSMQQEYDSGDFAKNLADCLALGDFADTDQRAADAKTRGKLFGAGVATAVAATGGRDYEHAEIRFDAGGGVVLLTGSMDHGQGHGTTFKQVLSEKLGIDADLIRYRYGDSDLVTMGIGTFGSRSAQLAGSTMPCSSPAGSLAPAPTARWVSPTWRDALSILRCCPMISRRVSPIGRILVRRTPRRFPAGRISAKLKSMPKPGKSH